MVYAHHRATVAVVDRDDRVCFCACLRASRNVATAVFCGLNHAAAITEKGSLFVWGDGEAGQLGINERCKQSSRPYLVRGPHTPHDTTRHHAAHTHHTATHARNRPIDLGAHAHPISPRPRCVWVCVCARVRARVW